MTIPAPVHSPVSLYGPLGWTRSSGVEDLLAPFLAGARPASDFARFEGLGSEEARALLEILPEANMRDRQNNGPELVELLALAAEREGVELAGYLVSAPRWDERVSVDGLLVPSCEGLPEPLDSDPLVLAKWAPLQRALGLSSARGAPDELVAVRLEGGGRGWWIWWD